MKKKFSDILENLPDYNRATRDIQDILLTNLVMIGEIPAPTFGEQKRISLLEQRMGNVTSVECSIDDHGNLIGILTGRQTDRNILLVAHADTVFDEFTDHTVSVHPDIVQGPGLGDDSLGLAAMATLPLLLDRLKLDLACNLVLLATPRSLGRGNLSGLKYFLEHAHRTFEAGICLEGVRLGRLSYSSLGMLRGEISVEVPEESDWTRFGSAGAIRTLNEIINRMNDIPIPSSPHTQIIFGSVEGGTGYGTLASQVLLRFELRSESEDMVRTIRNAITDITAEVSSNTGADVQFDILARRHSGGIAFSHPLVRASRNIMKNLDIKPKIYPSTSELSAFIDKKIPAVTVGLTTGRRLYETREELNIEPMHAGLAQVLAMVLAVDGGHCSER